MREDETREQQPVEPSPERPVRDPAYEAYLEWCRQRQRPWYNQGWFWALLTVAGLAILVWQLGSIGEAVRSSTEATREQTGAIREQGSWLVHQLRAIEQAITSLGHTIREAIAAFANG